MTTGTKVADLLPCPFCGPGESIVACCFDDVANRYRVYCGRCGSSTGIHPTDRTEAPAISAWNRRAALARQEADKTKAAIWIEFAENGNIRFWTSDQDRAIEESFCHARSLTAYYAAPPAAQAVDLDGLRELADAVVITNATGNERLFLGAVEKLLARVRALIDQQAGKGVDRG